MHVQKDTYRKYVEARAPKSPVLKNCLCAFVCGGLICTFGQLLRWLYGTLAGMNEDDAGLLCSVTLVAIAVILTGLGWFDKIAKHAGAGTLVPITGFANAVVSPAIDAKSEGLVLGVGTKIFTVAGPVLLYGTLAGALYGLIYRLILLFS